MRSAVVDDTPGPHDADDKASDVDENYPDDILDYDTTSSHGHTERSHLIYANTISNNDSDDDEWELLARIESYWQDIAVFAVHNIQLDNPLPAHFGLSLYYNQQRSTKGEKEKNCGPQNLPRSWPKSYSPATLRLLPSSEDMMDISEILRPWISIPLASPKSAREFDIRRTLVRMINAFPKEERARFMDILELDEEELDEEPVGVEGPRLSVVGKNGGKIRKRWFWFSR